MLNWLINLSLRNRFLVVMGALAFAVGGAIALRALDIDAFPDTSMVQVQVNTTAPTLTPEDVESQNTARLEQELAGLPRLNRMHSISKFGLSQVVLNFEDGTDIYFARQQVTERLAKLEMPAGVERPSLGPISTGLGEVFHYVLSYKATDLSKASEEERARRLTELRTLHEWVIKPKLRTVKGVAEVNTWGGYEKQYQVRIQPERLIKHGLTFGEVFAALNKNNQNVGGGSIRQGSQMLLVHGIGRTETVEQVRNVVVSAKDGAPTRIRDVADVEIGHEIRQGAVTAHGKGEAILGLCFMLMGENSKTVTTDLKKKLSEIEPTLPPDVQIDVVYDRTELVDYVIDTVRRNLFEGGLLVVAILFAFLGNLRAALIVAMAIPLSMLFAFGGMWQFGIAASLLSLGAIDFGMVVDSSVVMVENCVRHIAHGDLEKRELRDVVRDAAVEVRKPTLFGELIIMIVYLPILTLEGVEGKLFRPMALTVIFALLGSMVLSLTLMPVLASLVLPRRIREREAILMRLAHWIHAPVLNVCMNHPIAVVGIGLCLVAFAFGMIAPHMGAEFMPKLSEGSITIGIVRLAGTDLEESIRVNTRMEQDVLREFPDEVKYVWARIGTAEVATDPMGVELTDFYIMLHPRSQWKKAAKQEELSRLIERRLRSFPGQRLSFMQPIEHRMNEMISGVRSDVGIKLYGDDYKVLVEKGTQIESVLKSIPGGEDVSVEQVTGQPVLQVKIKQDVIDRYGIPASEVLELIHAVGTLPVGEVIEEQKRFPLVVRLPEKNRGSPDAIGATLIATPSGERVPLSRLATIQVVEGPSTITREWGQRRITIQANVRGRDLVGFVDEAKSKIGEKVLMPSERYHLDWGGQFENFERARLRLFIVVPVAGILIFVLLFLTYRNVVDAFRVFTGVPFGWVGGIIALWLRDMPFSISAAVGFIALSGVAVLDDMILVSYVRQLRRKGLGVHEAVRQAAITRLRPVLMTTLVASFGFLPMALSTGQGAEVQRPLATVVIGGVIGAMVMSLLVLRVLYLFFDWIASGAFWLGTRVLLLPAPLLRTLLGIQLTEADDVGIESQSRSGSVATVEGGSSISRS